MPGVGGLPVLDVDIKSMVFQSSEGDTLEALKDLRFSCAANSFTSIVGPSGCGKTTTLRCILGLETSFEGEIKISGQLAGAQNDGGKISAVFQEPRLLPWRTVEQNVKLVLGNNVDEASLEKLFTELGLAEHQRFYPTELSLGLARRVGLARAFAVEPSVLILDEPFVSLDDDTASRLRRLLAQVWSARSCTALMVTHNLREAIELSDRILFYSGVPSRVAHDFEIPEKRENRDRHTVDKVMDQIEELGLAGQSV